MDPVIPPPRLPTVVDLATFLAEHDAEGHHTTISEATAAALALKADASTLAAHEAATAAHGATGAVVGTTNAQTLTNKTLTTPSISGGNIDRASITVMDSGFSLVDDADNTKVARFIATGLTPATIRSLTIPDKDGTLALLDDVALKADATALTTHTAATAAHGASGAVVGTTNTQTLTNKTLTSPAFTGTPTGLTKSHVGLANVDNTADASKPVSTAQAAALIDMYPWMEDSLGSNAYITVLSLFGGTTGTFAYTANWTYAAPFIPPLDMTINQLFIEVTTGVAASQAILGVWGVNASGAATGSALRTSAAVSTAAAGYVGASITNLTLTRGTPYLLCLVVSGTSTYRSVTPHRELRSRTGPSNSAAAGYVSASAPGFSLSLPANGDIGYPLIGVRTA